MEQFSLLGDRIFSRSYIAKFLEFGFTTFKAVILG